MTTYSHTIKLNDTEIIMLKSALKLLIENCEEHLKVGDRMPYLAHKDSAERVLKKLYSNTIQTSSNTFFGNKKEDGM